MTTRAEQELPELYGQNKATLGRLLAHGNLGRAEEGSDGRLHAHPGPLRQERIPLHAGPQER